MFGTVTQTKIAKTPRTAMTIADWAAARIFVPTRLSASITSRRRVMKRWFQALFASSPTKSAVA